METTYQTTLPQHKYLTFLIMLYLTIMLCSAVLIYKPIEMKFGYASGATITFPLWFVLSDLIAEVYGFKISKKILWTGFFCQFIFSLLCFLLINIPSPPHWAEQHSFDLVLGHLLKITIVAFATIMISGYLNIYLITKWKILLRGKYFWMRSCAASIIGEGIYSVIATSLLQYGMVPLSDIPIIIFWGYSFKICCTVFLATPANLICRFLKKSEGIDIYEASTFYPF